MYDIPLDMAAIHFETLRLLTLEPLSSRRMMPIALLLHLKYDFPTEWHRLSTSAETANFSAMVIRDYFPYFIAGRNITPRELQLNVVQEKSLDLFGRGAYSSSPLMPSLIN